ncbi:MAG: bifunctional nicotinamidase/pyrazinamidase [Burkholderiales bacterium]|nr:bifunctional nicotinamidase/pyrazinamidase [Burkholderiales bacterium]
MSASTDRRRFLQLASGFGLAAGTGALAPAVAAPSAIAPTAHDALVVIDVQKCFVPGGSLAVTDGDAVVPVINALAKKFDNVVLTQDWHTADHMSFASSHAGRKPFETIDVYYGKQVLWPDHCVQGTEGAEFAPGLDIPHAIVVVRKGMRPKVDSYSAFYDADGRTATGLGAYLKARGIRRLYFAGLATDFCVAWSAIDARRDGFQAAVVDDACRGIDLNGSLAKAWADMTKKGVKKVVSSDFA